MTKIFTYYAECPGISAFDSLRLINQWRERWAAIGFEPFVMSEHQARAHPYFDEFAAGVAKLPTQNSVAYEQACFHRWLALAQMGGGFLADYDVLPTAAALDFDFKLTGKQKANLQILQSNCVCPCLSWASKSTAERVCREFVTREFPPHEINGKPHVSDQYLIENMVLAGADWIEQQDWVRMYGDEGWNKQPFVHLANRALSEKGMLPRWKFVNEILK